MRCVLKKYLDIVELYARSQIAHRFSLVKCVSPPYNQHYDEANYYNKKSFNEIISAALDREKEHSKDALFVIHHSAKYDGKMPLWVIVELLSFTNLSKLYSAMYYSEQDTISISMGITSNTLRNHLHCLANLRNKVAHAGRLYNVTYNPPVILGKKYLKKNPDINPSTLFAYLVALLRRIPNNADKVEMIEDIRRVMVQYNDCVQLPLLGFPKDYCKLLNALIK